ncbi:mucoidy inhibitor MuiA [Desulfothermus okinawensis JCM 13304]
MGIKKGGLVFFLFFVFGLLTSVYGYAEGKIVEVVLYPDMALLKKEINISLKKGENQLKLTGFPVDMIDNSVQIQLLPVSVIEILDVKVEKDYSKELGSSRIKELKQKIYNLNREIKEVSNKINSIKTAIEFIKSTNPFPANLKVSPKEVENFSNYIIKSLDSKYAMVLKLNEKLDNLLKRKQDLENKLNEISSQTRSSKDIYLNVYSRKRINSKIKVSYLVKSAGWKYAYDVKVDSNKKSISIYTYAIIKQSTGEDWKSVHMELSTARPNFRYVPELHPWYLDIYNPPVYKSKGMLKLSRMMRAPSLEEISSKGNIYKGSYLKENQASYSFVLPGRRSIPSDNKEHRVYLSSKATSGEFLYTAVPKLYAYASLVVSLKNPLKYPIMPGNVKVFLDGMFINKFFVKKGIMPGEKLNLSLGVDESIKTTKKLIKKYTQYKGLVSKQIKVSFEYQITIRNGKGRKIRILVKDNIPVSRNEKIKVKLLAPKEGVEISKDGIITWDLKLSPAQVVKLPVKFTVEYPKEVEITGL